MKNLALFCVGMLVCLATTLPCAAQPQGDTQEPASGQKGEQSKEQRIEMWSKRLGLSESQKTQFSQVIETTKPGEERRQALQKIFTADQMEKWKQMMARQHERRQEKETEQPEQQNGMPSHDY